MSERDGYQVASDVLGYPGAMLSSVKRTPQGREGHTIYWNACVFQKTSRKDAVQIWHGDLDVTARADELRRLANTVGTTVYVTPEQPWRFDGFRETMKRSQDAERMIRFDPEPARHERRAGTSLGSVADGARD